MEAALGLSQTSIIGGMVSGGRLNEQLGSVRSRVQTGETGMDLEMDWTGLGVLYLS